MSVFCLSAIRLLVYYLLYDICLSDRCLLPVWCMPACQLLSDTCISVICFLRMTGVCLLSTACFIQYAVCLYSPATCLLSACFLSACFLLYVICLHSVVCLFACYLLSVCQLFDVYHFSICCLPAICCLSAICIHSVNCMSRACLSDSSPCLSVCFPYAC